MALADAVDVYHGTCFEYGQMEETILVPRNKLSRLLTGKPKRAEKHGGIRFFKCLPHAFRIHSVTVVLVTVFIVALQNIFL